MKSTNDPSERIVISVTIAVIEPGNGSESMVASAFLAAGQYIDSRASVGQDADVEFEYRGVKFHAGAYTGNGPQ